MTPQAYNTFTQTLQQNLTADPRVIGLIALGSMAQQDYQPDQWSDHDFFVIVQRGQQAAFHQDLSWLPHAQQIVWHFRETAHGDKVLYAHGHLLEYAVFDEDELALAQVNRYRILLDKADLAVRLADMAGKGGGAAMQSDDALLGSFLTNLLVGIGRFRRGEQLSAHAFVKHHAMYNLLALLQNHLPAEDKTVLDNLDPFRRLERPFPHLAAEFSQIMLWPVPQTAVALLDIAERELQLHVTEWPATAVTIVRQYCSTYQQESG